MSSQTGTVSSTTGTGGWTNPQNIYTSNNTYATQTVAGSTVSGYIYALGNGFSIPSGATIDGIELTVEGKNSLTGNGMTLRPSAVSDCYLRSSGSDISTPASSGIAQQVWTSTSDQTKIFGSSTSLWGANITLTPSIINDSSFGFRMRFLNNNTSSQTFSIDRIAITVYYTEAGVQSSQQLFMYEG